MGPQMVMEKLGHFTRNCQNVSGGAGAAAGDAATTAMIFLTMHVVAQVETVAAATMCRCQPASSSGFRARVI